MRKKLLLLFSLTVALSATVFSVNRRTVCASCIASMTDTEEYICRTGYGRGSTHAEADSLAYRDAYMALLQVAKKAAKKNCREVQIGQTNGKDFLAIKYIDRKEKQERYYFTQNSLLITPPLFCASIACKIEGGHTMPVASWLPRAKR